MKRTSLLVPCLTLLAGLSLSACARSSERAPLPGDSVAVDGAVSLATPRLVTAATTPATREPLSALERSLLPAELIMEHKAAIALLPAQQEAITKELDQTQSELVKLQWQLQTEKDKLVEVLGAPKVDEVRAQKTAESLMRAENAIKASHLGMLVRIKNVLTAAQQEQLRALRDDARCAPAAPKDAGRD
jgi:Spy/CpxP family protein refolding chaperone